MPLNDSEQQLFQALEIQDPSLRFEQFKTALAIKVDIHLKNRFGKTPLMVAVERGDIHCIQHLLSLKANVNDQDVFGNTVLMTAIDNKDLQTARLLVEAAADIDALNKKGFSALEIAMDQKDFLCMRLLLERKVHIKNIHELIFLIFDHKQILLLNILMDVYQQQNYLERIFEGAANYGYIHVVRKLSALVSTQVKKHAILLAARNQQVDIVHELYPQVSLSDEKRQELFFIAAKKGNLSFLTTLLTAKVKVNMGDGFETPLAMAVKSGNSACVKKLLEFKANIHQKSRFGTPLLIAAIHRHAECLKVLLEEKANPDQAASFNANDLFSYESTPLEYVAEHGDSTCMKLLLAYKANVNTSKTTAMVEKAAKEGNTELVKLLIDANANVDKVETNFPMSVLDNFNLLKKQAECVSLIRDAVSEKTQLCPTRSF